MEMLGKRVNELEKNQEDILIQLKRLEEIVTKRVVMRRELTEVNSDINNQTAQGVSANDASPDRKSSSPIRSTRPVLVKKSSPQKLSLCPTYSSSSKVPQDKGRTCVSVFLRSRGMSTTERLNMIRKNHWGVDQLVSHYSLKFCYSSKPGRSVRIDYCFLHSEEASKFFKSVRSLAQSDLLIKCYLFTEEELGYQHGPVLTEHDLLAIESPGHCPNTFITSVPIIVKMKNDMVVYEFKTVSDINKFLGDRASSVKTMSLGLFKKNVVPKMITTDKEGFYRLVSEGSKITVNTAKKHGFTVDGPFLLFRNKLNLFAFLVSEDASKIHHLRFYEENIKDLSREDFVARDDGLKVDRTGFDILICSHEPSTDEGFKISNNSEKQEVEGISQLGRSSDKIMKEEALTVRSLPDQRDEEIRILKQKLLLMERIILTEIMEKTAAEDRLQKVLSQYREEQCK